jgi:2-(1,2-epoxy-1,2-dihydrophenyl)acetyl-CoA isomerase
VDDVDILKVAIAERVAVVTLNRPKSLNSLNPSLMRQLADALRKLSDNEDVRCLVLTGAGKGFCSGGDVRAISKAAEDRVNDTPAPAEATSRRPAQNTEQRARWLRRCAEASRLLHEMPKPTIAMINGACAGAGLSLAAACDFRIAAESAVFRPSFTPSGLPGDYGGSWLWTRILGSSKAKQLYFFDERRNAAQALAFGLVDEVCSDASLTDEVMVKARFLADMPGAGLAFAKQNLNAALIEGLAGSLDRESLNMMLARNVLVEARKAQKVAEGGGT